MKRQRANIRLLAAAELRQSGPLLALRKGVSQLRLPGRRNKPRPCPMPPAKQPQTLSLIFCTAGTYPGFSAALEAALNQKNAPPGYEILVVWNRPETPPADRFPRGIRWVSQPTPGLSLARNTGAAHASGEFLLYLDDDAIAAPNLAEIVFRTFLRHPRAAIVGGRIDLALPEPKPEAVLPGREGLWSAYTVPFKNYRPVRHQYAFPYGACFAVRRSVLTALGGFPLNYGRVGENFAGGEETALCFLARTQGWEVGIQPKARVEHRVDPRRFSREHVRQTLRSGILTTYRLCQEGYAPWLWDRRYIQSRMEIAGCELRRLDPRRRELEYFYKKCEYDAFAELLEKTAAPEGDADKC